MTWNLPGSSGYYGTPVMKPWQLIVIAAAVVIVAAVGWYVYEQQNRTLLSVETPGGSIEVNESGNGVSVEVNGQ